MGSWAHGADAWWVGAGWWVSLENSELAVDVSFLPIIITIIIIIIIIIIAFL